MLPLFILFSSKNIKINFLLLLLLVEYILPIIGRSPCFFHFGLN